MLAVRVHLNDCGTDNGPLRCAAGSHRLGIIPSQHILPTVKRLDQSTCTTTLGGLVFMRPLCLHASSPASSPNHRRVIHIEFAASSLPAPLDWHERHPLST